MVPSTTALTLNMQLPNIATVAWAVQGDTLARKIQATLIDGSTAWTPPTGAAGVIRYFKPDGTNGVYDVDEAGDPAVVWSGNVATITIVQQALTVPGTVKMQLEFYDTNSQRLSAFGWCMNVEPSAVTDNEFLSADYYNILSEQIAAVLAAAGSATPGDALPLMDGTAAPGTALPYSRQDHVHPIDTSRASATALNNKLLRFTGSISGSITNAQMIRFPSSGTNSALTENSYVVSCEFGTPSNVVGDVTVTKNAGYFTLTGSTVGSTTVTIIMGN